MSQAMPAGISSLWLDGGQPLHHAPGPLLGGQIVQIAGPDALELPLADGHRVSAGQVECLVNGEYLVHDNMGFALKIAGTPKDEIRKRVEKAAEILDLTEYLDRKPKALSGGQRQRVAMGRAIVREPKVFLMDEPLSNLDAKLRNQMRAEIIKLRSRINTTFVYVTHDQTEAMTLGDRIVIMRDGFIQQIGTPQEVFNHPKNLFVAGFIGTPQMNFFPDAKLTVKDGKYVVELLGKSIVLPEDKQAALRARKQPEGTVTVGVRPVHLSLHQEGFPATIDVSEMMGSEMHLHMTVSGHDVIAVIPTAGLSLDDVRAGGTAHFTFDPELMHLFDPKTEENLFPVENTVPVRVCI